MLHKLKHLLKLAIAYLLYYSGLLHLYKRLKLGNRACVLMYHRVLPDELLDNSFSNRGIIVRASTFRRHLRFLAKHFHIVSMSEFINHLDQRLAFPRNACLLTFDDGWFDNFEYATPILREHGATATVFLPYNYIDADLRFWQEELACCLQTLMRADSQAAARFLTDVGCTASRDAGRGEMMERVFACISRLKARDYTEIDRFLQRARELCAGLEQDVHVDRYLDWLQVRQMQDAGIEFGSHCLSHRILTRIAPAELNDELANSKQRLESHLAKPVKALAYPNGDYNQTVIDCTRQSGYSAAFSTRRGYVDADTDRYAIPRINIHDRATCNTPLMLCTMLGIF